MASMRPHPVPQPIVAGHGPQHRAPSAIHPQPAAASAMRIAPSMEPNACCGCPRSLSTHFETLNSAYRSSPQAHVTARHLGQPGVLLWDDPACHQIHKWWRPVPPPTLARACCCARAECITRLRPLRTSLIELNACCFARLASTPTANRCPTTALCACSHQEFTLLALGRLLIAGRRARHRRAFVPAMRILLPFVRRTAAGASSCRCSPASLALRR